MSGICVTCVYTCICMPSVRECAKANLSKARLPQEPPPKKPGDTYSWKRGQNPSEAAGLSPLRATLDGPALTHAPRNEREDKEEGVSE